MKRRGSNSFQTWLFIVLLSCMTGMVIIVSLLFYNRTTEQLRAKIHDLSSKNVAQTIGLFDLVDKGFDSLSKSISNNFDLVRLLTSHPTEPQEQFANERAITNIIGTNFFSRDDLIGIHVMTNQKRIYNYGNYINEVKPGYDKTGWYKSIVDEGGKIVWLGLFPTSVIDENETRPVLAFGRQLYDLDVHKPIGVVLYETSPAPILKALENLKLSSNSKVYLLDERGSLVSATDGSEDLPAFADVRRPESVGETQVYSRDGRLVVTSSLPFADWTAVTVTPEKDLNVELVEMRRYLFIVGLILILVSIIVATILSNTISSPLKRVIREMKKVELGNFQGQVQVRSYREINSLAGSFNEMVRQIDQLVERVKISSMSEKNAELLALQSQVNPHFLYNTLDMIYWMLDEKEEDHLGEVVLSLSRMFRYSSHWEQGALVTLGEELEQIRDYLTIITIRLEGRVSVNMEVPPEYLSVPLPKMTLQPIIENAVKHGLEPLGGEGCLVITAGSQGARLTITVKDNGVGMDAAALAMLRASLDSEINAPGGVLEPGIKRKGGIGLPNVHRRLIHTFGPEYGLRLSSERDGGTTASITLPLPPRQTPVIPLPKKEE
ncbi:sensor histidine kinase [Paenibacillus sp. RU4T]|uniref:cache domain-containing sensor histidine kinase n=1 Tax=unclassified Paenibacillus TaxID=185978 RepID=UPI00095571E8|nr:two-component system, sensor histidine kinase YesM [Paenibacillus sp. RU4X]SIR50753.1 two-component system, sensor histidine kinase YesM [Paenibacillus sp. RU4T]